MGLQGLEDALGQVDFATLGLDPAGIEQVSLLREKETHRVCRLAGRQGSFILKWFHSPAGSVELHTYSLLRRLGVPTLPVHAQTDRALLLEDIHSSPRWRLADEADMGLEETGRAVAAWYRALHRAGRETLAEPASPLPWLVPWVQAITRPALEMAGATLGLQETPAWKLVLERLEVLRARYRSWPQTFNYNDFAAENLALSRDGQHPRDAVVFDYDCFATGTAYSDWRNVASALRGAARAAFAEAYGPVDEGERWLDEPLAALYGLVVASRRKKFPRWAAPLVEEALNGTLERSIRRGCEVEIPSSRGNRAGGLQDETSS